MRPVLVPRAEGHHLELPRVAERPLPFAASHDIVSSLPVSDRAVLIPRLWTRKLWPVEPLGRVSAYPFRGRFRGRAPVSQEGPPLGGADRSLLGCRACGGIYLYRFPPRDGGVATGSWAVRR